MSKKIVSLLPVFASVVVMVCGLASFFVEARAASPDAFVEALQVTANYPDKYNGVLSAEHDDVETSSIVGFAFKDSRGESFHYTLDEIRKGVVVLSAFGKDIVHIKSPAFTKDAGGEMTITFYRKFFGGDRRQLRVEYLNAGGGRWVLLTNDQQGRDEVDSIFLRIDKSFGIPQSIGQVKLSLGQKLQRDLDPAKLPKAGRRRSVYK